MENYISFRLIELKRIKKNNQKSRNTSVHIELFIPTELNANNDRHQLILVNSLKTQEFRITTR